MKHISVYHRRIEVFLLTPPLRTDRRSRGGAGILDVRAQMQTRRSFVEEMVQVGECVYKLRGIFSMNNWRDMLLRGRRGVCGTLGSMWKWNRHCRRWRVSGRGRIGGRRVRTCALLRNFHGGDGWGHMGGLACWRDPCR